MHNGELAKKYQVHRWIQDFFQGGAQGQAHPDVYWLHSSEDPTAQVTFFNKHSYNHTHFR